MGGKLTGGGAGELRTRQEVEEKTSAVGGKEVCRLPMMIFFYLWGFCVMTHKNKSSATPAPV